MTTTTSTITKVTYRISPNDYSVFTWYPGRNVAIVNHSNGTSSQTSEGQVPNLEVFKDYIISTIGEKLIGNIISPLGYLLDKNFAQKLPDITIDAAVLIAVCMTDHEQTLWRGQAKAIDDECFKKTGERFSMDRFESAIIGRYRPDVVNMLRQFEEALKASS